jgi:hypothetical protein
MTEIITDVLQIYVDLDGVLVDFDKFAADHIGISPRDWDNNRQLKGQFWGRVARLGKEGKQFFGAMDPMADAFELWSYVEKYDPIILSATGHHHNAEHEKRDWVRRFLGDRFAETALFVIAAADKARYATSNSVLIDDRAKAINPWLEAGGTGVHHVSAADSIEQLKELGI